LFTKARWLKIKVAWVNGITFSYLKVYLEGDHLLLIRKPYHIFGKYRSNCQHFYDWF
jgi:hypothetical protein